MTNIWKRSISMFLALVMVFGMLPVNAFATETDVQVVEEASITEPVIPETTAAPVVQTTAAPVVETTAAPVETTAAAQTTAATEAPAAETTAAAEAPAETTAGTEAPVVETTAATEAPVEQTTAPAETTVPAEEEESYAVKHTNTSVPSGSLPSDEELFAGYAEQQFYGTQINMLGTVAGERLSGDLKVAYDALVPYIKAIASGERASATVTVGYDLGRVTFGDGSSGTYNAEANAAFTGTTFTQENLDTLLAALLADLPYELYWFDKVTGLTDLVVVSNSRMNITFQFTVAKSYRGANILTVDTAKTGAAKATAAAAQAVVDQVAADESIKTDYDKLVAYRDWICDAVSYNYSAASANNFVTSCDPWQVIYVFDGDSTTKVVCEGYSKAFQYLCDLTEFEGDVTCYSVTGTMTFGGKTEAHMWNIVEIGKEHYLVDVTNSDSGTAGSDGSLFMAGAAVNGSDSYTIGSTTYTYDDTTKEMWADTAVLSMSSSSYDPVQSAADAQTALEEGLAAAASAGQSYYLEESITLTRDLTVTLSDNPYQGYLWITDGGNLTVPSGITLTLNNLTYLRGGNLTIQQGGKLVFGRDGMMLTVSSGTLTVEDSAEVEFSNYCVIAQENLNDTQIIGNIPAENLQAQPTVTSDAEMRAALALEGYGNFNLLLSGDVTLANDFVLPANATINIMSNSKVIVPDGVTMTVQGQLYAGNNSGSALQINAGGTLNVDGGWVSVTQNALINNGTVNGNINIAGGTTSSAQDEFLTALETAIDNGDEGFGWNQDLTLTGDMTINLPEDRNFWVDVNSGATLTVPEGITLTINGSRSNFNFYNSKLVMNGTLVLNSGLFIHGTSVATIGESGVVNSNGSIHVGMVKDAGAAAPAGTLIINGTVNSYGYFAVHLDGTESGGVVTVNGTLNSDWKDNMSGFIDCGGEITIAKGGVVSVRANGIGNGGLMLGTGSDQSDRGTLTNNGTLTIEDNNTGFTVLADGTFVNASGARFVNNGLTIVDGGTYTNNGTVTGNKVIVTTVISQADFLKELAAANGENYSLADDLIVTSDMTIPAGTNTVVESVGSITVKNGAKLTLEGNVYISGSFVVEEGGALAFTENTEGLLYQWSGNLALDGADLSEVIDGRIIVGVGPWCTTTGIDTIHLTGENFPMDTFSIQAAINNADKYYHTKIIVGGDLTLDASITIPENASLILENVTVKIPSGLSVVNNGELLLNEGGRLIVEEGASLTNNGYMFISDFATLLVLGNYTENGDWDGSVDYGTMSQDDLQSWMDDCAANGWGWIHESETRLERNMTIDLGDKKFQLSEYATIIIPNGVYLIMHNDLILNEGSKIIVEDGGHLIIDGQGEGKQLILNGGAVLENNGRVVNNKGTIQVMEGASFHNNNLVDNGIGTFIVEEGAEYTQADEAEFTNALYQGGTGTVTGIEKHLQTLFHGYRSEVPQHNEDTIRDAIELFETEGYRFCTIWVMQDLNLTEDLEIPECVHFEVGVNGRTAALIIPKDVTVTNDGGIHTYQCGQVTIRDGAVLENNGWINNEGTVYVAGEFRNNGDLFNNGVTYPGDIQPYLSYRWLDNNDGYWYEDPSKNLENGMGTVPGNQYNVAFYLNYWNETALCWDRVSIDPAKLEVSNNLQVVPFSTMEGDEDYRVQDGENSAGFLRLITKDNTWDTDASITYTMEDDTEVVFELRIARFEGGFYTQPIAANEYWLNAPQISPLQDEYVFYFIFESEYWDLIEDDNSPRITSGGHLVDMEYYSDNIYKITVKPEVMEGFLNTGGHELDLEYELAATFEEDLVETRSSSVWMHPHHGENSAGFEIDNQYYTYVEEYDGFLVRTQDGIFAATLPEGVSYDYDTNTLTLENAELENISLSYFWQERDEFGNLIPGGNSGYDLPSAKLNLELIGENSIICSYRQPLELHNGVHLNIQGDGSLHILGQNSPDNVDENGRRYALNAGYVSENSKLTVGDNATVTVEVAGKGYYGDEGAFLQALHSDGGTLTVTGNATLTTVAPEDAKRYDNRKGVDSYAYVGYAGIDNFGKIIVEDTATLNTCDIRLNDNGIDQEGGWSGAYIQNGGTVNINSLAGLSTTDEGKDHYHYDGIATDHGTITINGGVLNLNVAATAAERASSSNFNGLYVCGGEINLNGGEVNVNGVGNGCGVNVDNWWSENNEPHHGGTLNMNGGTLNTNYDLVNGGVAATAIDVAPISTANFTGGTINAANAYFMLGGYKEDGSAVIWDGTELYADLCGFYVDGSFEMNGGLIQMENLGALAFNGMAGINGGKIDLYNSVMRVETGTGFDKNAIVNIEIDEGILEDEYDYALLVNGYMSIVDDAEITINVNLGETDRQFRAVLNNGTFHQMGGHVSVNSDVLTIPAFASLGATYINGGTMDVNGNRCGFMQDYNFDRPAEAPEQMLYMNGGELNVSGSVMGLYVHGIVHIDGGSLNAYAEGIADNSTGIWPQAVRVEEVLTESGMYVSWLTIQGGNHTLTAVDTSDSEACSKGIATWHAPVTITTAEDGSAPVVNIDAEMALYSMSDSLDNTNIKGDVSFVSGITGRVLNITSREFTEAGGGTYFHTLMEEDGYAETVSTTFGQGEKWHWELQDGILTIYGEGAMDDYGNGVFAPWRSSRDSITGIVVEEGITHIGNFAFYDLYRAEFLNIPASVTTIGGCNFPGNTALENINVAADNAVYTADNGMLIKNGNTLAAVSPWVSGELEIPENIVTIADAAFDSCVNLTSIIIPASVTSIGTDAFVACDSLARIVFLGNAPKLANSMFTSDMIVNFVIPDGNTTWTTTIKNKLYGSAGIMWSTDTYTCAVVDTLETLQQHIEWGTTEILIVDAITVEDSLYLDSYIVITETGSLTIAEDAQLIIGRNGNVNVFGGTLDVDGSVVNNGLLNCDYGTISVVDGGYLHGYYAQHVIDGTYAGNNGAAIIEGIPEMYQNLAFYGDTEAKLHEMMDRVYEEGYGSGMVHIVKSMTLSKDLFVHNNVEFHVHNGAGTNPILTIPSGKTLINNGRVRVYNGGTVKNAGTVKNNMQFAVEDGGNLTSTSTGSVYNWVMMYVYGGGKITADGYWDGYDPIVVDGGVYTGKAFLMTQAKLETKLAEAADNGFPYRLSKSFTLTDNLTVDGTTLFVSEGAVLTVPKGKTLTINGSVIAQGWEDETDEIFTAGKVVVDVGGKVVINGCLASDLGDITMNGTYTLGADGEIFYNISANDNMGTITGIPVEDMSLQGSADTMGRADSLLTKARNEGFGGAAIVLRLEESTNIGADLYVGPNQRLIFQGYGYWEPVEVTLMAGKTITNDGTIELREGYRFILEGEIVGNEIWCNGGELVGGQEISQDQFEAALANHDSEKYYNYNMTKQVRLDHDMELNTGILLNWGGAIIVPNGVTLTINENLHVNSGSFIVEAGGHVVINAKLRAGWDPTVEIYGTYEIGTNQYDEEGMIQNFWFDEYEGAEGPSDLVGVALQDQVISFEVNNEAELQEALRNVRSYNAPRNLITICQSFTLTKDLRIPENCSVWVEDWSGNGTTITLPEGITLYNYGEMRIRWNATLVVNGNVVGNWPLTYSEGTITGSNAYMSQEDLEAALSGEGNGWVQELSVNLERNLTIAKNFYLDKGATITVPKDVTLTLSAPGYFELWGGHIVVKSGGTLILDDAGVNIGARDDVKGSILIEKGGKLVNNGYVNVTYGTLTNKGTYTHGKWANGVEAQVYNNTYAGYYHPYYSEITGISNQYQTLICVTPEIGALKDFISLTSSQKYGYGEIEILENFVLSENLTLPANVHMFVNNATLTIPENVTMTIGNGLDVENNAKIQVNGTLVNQENSAIFLNSGADMYVNGKVINAASDETDNNGAIHVGFHYSENNEIARGSELVVNGSGVLENSGYLNICPDGSVKVYGTVNNYRQKATIQISGPVDVYGTVNNYNHMYVSKGEDEYGNTAEKFLTIHEDAVLNNESSVVGAPNGILHIDPGAYVYNHGTLNNAGQVAVYGELMGIGGKFVNNGLLVNEGETGFIDLGIEGGTYVHGSYEDERGETVPAEVIQNYNDGNIVTVNGVNNEYITLINIGSDLAMMQNMQGYAKENGLNYIMIVGMGETLVIPQGAFLYIDEGSFLTVKPEATLEIRGNVAVAGGLYVVGNGGGEFAKGGSVIIHETGELHNSGSNAEMKFLEGSTVTNNNNLDAGRGTINMDGTYIHGENAQVSAGCVEGKVSPVNGIDPSLVSLVMAVPSQFVHDTDSIIALFDALKDGGYKDATAHIASDFELTKDLTIPENGKVQVGSYLNESEFNAVTLTIPNEVIVTNNGTIEVSKGSTLVINGILLGNDANGNVEGVPYMSQAKFEEELANGGYYGLNKRVVLTRDLELTDTVEIGQGGELFVLPGVKLTVSGSLLVFAGGKLDVRAGATLVNKGIIDNFAQESMGGYVKVRGEYIPGNFVSLYNAGAKTAAPTEGVPVNTQTLQYEGSSQQAMEDAIAYAKANGYYSVWLMAREMTITGKFEIPENVMFNLPPAGETVHIDGKVVNNGEIVVQHNSAIEVRAGGTLQINETGSVQILSGYGDIPSGRIYGEGTVLSMLNRINNPNLVACDLQYFAWVTSESDLISGIANGITSLVLTKDVTLTKALTIPSDTSILVDPGVTLTIQAGKNTIINNGVIETLGDNYGNNGTLKMVSGNVVNNKAIVIYYGTLDFDGGTITGNRVVVYENGTVDPENYGHYVRPGQPIESFVLTAETDRAAVGASVKLEVGKILPVYADYDEDWYDLYVNGEKLEGNTVTSDEPGTVTVTATTKDGKVSAKATITFVNHIVRADYMDAAREVTADNAPVSVLFSGGKLDVIGSVVMETADGFVPTDLMENKVVWSVNRGADFVDLTVKNNVATVKAKTITERQEVQLKGTSVDGSLVVFVDLVIRPKLEAVNVLSDGEIVTGKTVQVNLEETKQLALNLRATPGDALDNCVEFRVGNTGEYEPAWDVTIKDDKDIVASFEDGILTFKADAAAGTVELTFTTNGSVKKTAKVTVEASALPKELISHKDNRIDLTGGEKATYYVWNVEGTDKMTQSAVQWYLVDANGEPLPNGHAYASITEKGVLTTKAVEAVTDIYLQARMTAGGEDNILKSAESVEACDGLTVTLHPTVTLVEAYDNGKLLDKKSTVMVDFEDIAEKGYYDGLTAKAYPDGAVSDANITWKLANDKFATVDEDGNIYPVEGNKPGSVNMTVTATDYNGKSKKTATFKVQLGVAVKEIDIYANGAAVEDTVILRSNGSVNLTAELNKNHMAPFIKGVTWSLKNPAHEAYVTLNASSGALKAKTVYSPVTDIVIVATSKDGKLSESITVAVLPKADKNGEALVLQKDGKDYVTKSTLSMEAGDEFTLTAWSVDETANGYLTAETVTWSSNNSDAATVANGKVVAVDNGSATITATAADGKRTATVTVNVTKLSESVVIDKTDLVVASGKTLQLSAEVTYTGGTTDSNVTWSVSDPVLAKIDAKGKLTATKGFLETKYVEVTATAKDGVKSETVKVEIAPMATGVQILDTNGNVLNTINQPFYLSEGNNTLTLDVIVYPYTEAAKAKQDVKWTSSSKKVADFNAENVLEIFGAGTTNITAQANDGSNKKATFKLTVTKLMSYLELKDEETPISMLGGKSLNLATYVDYDSTATNKKLVWEILGSGTDFASINAGSGALKAKAVTSAQTIDVQVTSADDSDLEKIVPVTIYPATTKVDILNSDTNENLTGKTIDVPVGQIRNLQAITTPTDTMMTAEAADWEWTSSDKTGDYVTVSDNGVVSVNGSGKTITITAKATDGSNKTATVKIKAVQLVEEIQFAQNSNFILASGLTLKLGDKANSTVAPTNATNKKLNWKIVSGAEYATINTSTGVLKANKLAVSKTLLIEVTSADGNAAATCTVTIMPTAATKVTIVDAPKAAIPLYLGGDAAGLSNTVTLAAQVAPEAAWQDVIWTSSAPDYASVDEYGNVTALKGGKTVTITATSADGSNKKATAKVQTIQLMTDMEIVGQPSDGIHIVTGKNVTLKVNALPGTVANKNVTWHYVGDAKDYVTLSGAKLTAATNLTEVKTVQIQATAKDLGGYTEVFDVHIYPLAATSISYTGEAPVQVEIDGTVDLSDYVTSYDKNGSAETVAQAWTWTSGSAKVAAVNADGVVTGLKTGKATITCKTLDGSNKNVKINIQVVESIPAE